MNRAATAVTTDGESIKRKVAIRRQVFEVHSRRRGMEMIQEAFGQMADSFVRNMVEGQKSYYFSLDDVKKTVVVSGTDCTITDGKTVEQADCVCKTSPEFFMRIWKDGYRPGMKDFMTGTIKSNDPSLLQVFLKCFGKG